MFCFSLLLQSKRKVYNIQLNQLLAVISKRNVPEAWVSYFFTDLAARKIFCIYVCMYLCMCVCIHGGGCNFNPFDTSTHNTREGLVKRKIQFEDGLCRSHMSDNTFLQKFQNLMKVVISILLLPNLVYI